MAIAISNLPRQTVAAMTANDLFPLTSATTDTTKAITAGNLITYIGSQVTGNAYILPKVDGQTGQVLSTDGTGNVTWAWGYSGSGGTGVFESSVPPVNTSRLWYDTVSGRLYLYYSGAWVDASPASSNGYDGSTGFTGSIGYSGSIGPAGPTGQAGPSGALGYTGSAGLQGFPGLQGIQGIQGPIGYTGSSTGIELVAAPLNSTSAGVIGQLANDGTYLYVCVGYNNWVRVSLAGSW